MKYSVDWISGTNAIVRDEKELAVFARQITHARRLREGRGMYGYQYALIDENGVLFESGAREDMGTHIQASGTALTSLAMRQDGLERLMRMIDAIIPARVDLAVDTDTEFAAEFAKELENGRIKTKAHAWSVINSNDNGLTAYVGARSSDRFLRVYNKASEQGLLGVPWTRIELETKRKAARATKGYIKARGIDNACKDWIVGFADCELPDWRQAFTGVPCYWKSTKGQSNTRNWLLNVCAPAMRKLIEQGDDALFSDFTHKLFDDT